MDAEQIVRALAKDDPPVMDGWVHDDTPCAYCWKDPGPDPSELAGHEADCPWRLAREWVAAHPA
jgi:hypothetical protein